jgi:uncharacterized tellurite resistance protein B-like protein
MFESIRRLFRGQTADGKEPAFPPNDHRVAVAALAVHAIAIDGVVGDAEKAKLRTVLQNKFDLTEAETASLIEEARQRDSEAVDLYSFTSVVKRTLDEDGRKAVVEMLWKLAYADGEVHEFEDNLVWRVAELLGVSSRDRVRLRRQAEKMAGDDSAT